MQPLLSLFLHPVLEKGKAPSVAGASRCECLRMPSDVWTEAVSSGISNTGYGEMLNTKRKCIIVSAPNTEVIGIT